MKKVDRRLYVVERRKQTYKILSNFSTITTPNHKEKLTKWIFSNERDRFAWLPTSSSVLGVHTELVLGSLLQVRHSQLALSQRLLVGLRPARAAVGRECY